MFAIDVVKLVFILLHFVPSFQQTITTNLSLSSYFQSLPLNGEADNTTLLVIEEEQWVEQIFQLMYLLMSLLIYLLIVFHLFSVFVRNGKIL
jgi:hypothetical protein